MDIKLELGAGMYCPGAFFMKKTTLVQILDDLSENRVTSRCALHGMTGMTGYRLCLFGEDFVPLSHRLRNTDKQ